MKSWYIVIIIFFFGIKVTKAQALISKQVIDNKEAYWVETNRISEIRSGKKLFIYEKLKQADREFTNLNHLGKPIEIIHKTALLIDQWTIDYQTFQLVYEMRKEGVIELSKIVLDVTNSHLEFGKLKLSKSTELNAIAPQLEIDSTHNAQVLFKSRGLWDYDKIMNLELDKNKKLKTIIIEFNIAY